MLELAFKSIILSPNKSYPSPHQREPIFAELLADHDRAVIAGIVDNLPVGVTRPRRTMSMPVF